MRFNVAEESVSHSLDSDLTTEVVEASEVSAAFGLAGRDGWLFCRSAVDQLHKKPDNSDQIIDVWHQELASREVYFSAKRIQYFHVCVPDKLTIYGDMLNRQVSSYPVVDQFSPLELLSVNQPKLRCLINPTGYLKRQVGNYPLYWKSDTRWTPWSAYMAGQLLCSPLKTEINNQLLGYPYDDSEQLMNLDGSDLPDDPEQIRTYRYWLRSKVRYSNELAKLRKTALNQNDPLLSQAEYGEGAHVVYENRHEKSLKRCLVIFGDDHSADSRTLLSGMLAETFSEVHFVWSSGIDYDYVEIVQPDVVITQGSELQLLGNPSANLSINELAECSLERLKNYLSADVDLDISNNQTDVIDVVTASSFETNTSADTDGRKIILPAERYALDAPLMVQAHENVPNAETLMLSNEVVLHELTEAQVFFNGKSLWVHDKNNQEILRDNIPQTQKPAGRWRRGKRLKGTTMLFATSAGAHCYYHWMLEIMPKLGMLEREGISLDSIDHFLVREITAKWQLETLARFGIHKSRIVETSKQPQWRCDNLLHIDLNCGINLKMHRFIPQWMKHIFPVTAPQEPRIKLYITRPKGVRRGIANEHEFLPLLEEAGFTIMAMEGLSVAGQAALLARVDVLMSPHGGALTNMVFCRPGITVIEMFSRHVFPYYYGLAANCGHHYHAILENPEQDYPRLVNSAVAQSFADTQHETSDLSFDVPVDAIRAVLQLV